MPDIRIKNVSITRSSSVKFLGVIVDEKLSFKKHIEHVSKKLSIGIGFLYWGRKILNSKQLTLMYKASIQPYLTYCNLVWGINYSTDIKNYTCYRKEQPE